MFTRIFVNNFFRITLSTNDKRIAALLEKAMDFKGKPSSRCIPVSFHILFDEKVAFEDSFYTYTHMKLKSGQLVTCLNSRLASVSVNEANGSVTGQAYNLDGLHHPALIQTLFIDPLIQLLNVQGYHFLHAALVAKDEKCVLVCGPPGSGKSTFSLTLALQGHELLTDDKCLFKQDGGMYSFLLIRQKIGVQPHIWQKFSKLRKFRAEIDHDGKRKRIDADSFIKNSGNKRQFIPQAILFPEFKKRRALQLKKLGPQKALEYLLSDINNTYNAARNKKTATENLFAMHQLTRQIPAFHILYDDNQIKDIPKIIAPLLKQTPK